VFNLNGEILARLASSAFVRPVQAISERRDVCIVTGSHILSQNPCLFAKHSQYLNSFKISSWFAIIYSARLIDDIWRNETAERGTLLYAVSGMYCRTVGKEAIGQPSLLFGFIIADSHRMWW
jgi:hypothetical protein